MPAVNYAVRLTASFETLQTTVADWAMVSKHILCYEHPEPGNIHCHLLLYGVYQTTENLKTIMRSHGVALKGAGQLSFKTTFTENKVKIEITDETIPKFITYMSKGKYDPKYNKGYDEIIPTCKSAWITYTKEPPAYLLYLEFFKIVEPNTRDVKSLARYAHAFSMGRHRSHTPTCRKEQSQLIDDYCYYNSISKEYRLPYQPF